MSTRERIGKYTHGPRRCQEKARGSDFGFGIADTARVPGHYGTTDFTEDTDGEPYPGK
jgi:hypothetical protein